MLKQIFSIHTLRYLCDNYYAGNYHLCCSALWSFQYPGLYCCLFARWISFGDICQRPWIGYKRNHQWNTTIYQSTYVVLAYICSYLHFNPTCKFHYLLSTVGIIHLILGLSEQGIGHLQHFDGYTDILRFLHNIRHSGQRYIVQRMVLLGR
jgi:hypothetical protein